jgi:hypothetical protein
MAQTHLTLEQLTFLTNNMATSLSLENDSSLAQGYIKVNGTTAATLTTSGITGNLTGNVTGNVTGSLTAGGSLTLATAQTASGTAVDFTGIPSWVKRITVIFQGVSTNGSSRVIIQIGAVSFDTTGYLGSVGIVNFSTGFGLDDIGSATGVRHGSGTLSLIGSNSWIWAGCGGRSDASGSQYAAGGSKTISGTLDRIRITTVNGTDTFDAGTINISYEG